MPDAVARTSLPIPDRVAVGPTTYDAKDPETAFPPIRDIRFILDRLLGGAGIDAELLEPILDEAGRFAAGVIAPLNRPADEHGCTRHADGSVTTPPGFCEATCSV